MWLIWLKENGRSVVVGLGCLCIKLVDAGGNVALMLVGCLECRERALPSGVRFRDRFKLHFAAPFVQVGDELAGVGEFLDDLGAHRTTEWIAERLFAKRSAMFIQKHYKPTDLIATLRSVLDRREC